MVLGHHPLPVAVAYNSYSPTYFDDPEVHDRNSSAVNLQIIQEKMLKMDYNHTTGNIMTM